MQGSNPSEEERRRRIEFVFDEKAVQEVRQTAAAAWLHSRPTRVQRRLGNHLKLLVKDMHRGGDHMNRYGYQIDGPAARKLERITDRQEVLRKELAAMIASADPERPAGSDENAQVLEGLSWWAFNRSFR